MSGEIEVTAKMRNSLKSIRLKKIGWMGPEWQAEKKHQMVR